MTHPERWLLPRPSTLLVFTGLYLLALGASIQAWVFSDGYAPKPALYDLLAPLPLWPVGILPLLPLAILTAPFVQPGRDLLSPNGWPGAIIVGLYLYMLSCALVGLTAVVRAAPGGAAR